MSSSPLSFESYQVDPTFPPNKESSWPYPNDHDGMVLTNNSIRGELSCLKQALDSMVHRGTFLDWEILAIQRMWISHFTHMNDVRRKEDDKFKPLLTKRFRMPESIALDYSIILEHLTILNKLVGDLHSTHATNNIQKIQEEFKVYDVKLSEYLFEKENKVLPRIRAYFTSSEWGNLLRETSRNDPPQTMGSFIHFQTEQRFRSVFMKQQNIPGFVWLLIFRGIYTTFQKDFLQPYETLLKGTEA